MKPSAIILAKLLVRHDITSVILSPGSRNAPLIVAMSLHKHLQLIDVIDERSAGFLALGMAKQTQQPVALVCTSGTALLNYAPAIAEAYYQGIPLIVLSADRPMQWIDQDDSQTIHQPLALNNFVKKSFDIPDFDSADREMKWYASRTINEAILSAKKEKQGPVHINMQFNAPLCNSTFKLGNIKAVKLITGTNEINIEQAKILATHLAGKKILIVAGYLAPSHKLSKALNRFIGLPNVSILAETIANLHLQQQSGIDRILTGLTPEELNSLLPDIVITIGGALLSRKIKEWLRSAPSSMKHWSLDQAPTLADCFCHLSLKITTEPVQFFSTVGRLLRKMNSDSDYNELWSNYKLTASASATKFLSKSPWCDLLAHYIIFNNIPKDWNICCSNGTSIRYAELFASSSQHSMSCNRGTSGIEGCTATAVGQALEYSGNTLLITGDMSFIHDLGGFSLPQTPSTFKIIVFNNRGGDIFRFIPSTSALNEREDHFSCSELCASSCKNLAKTFNYDYLYAHDVDELHKALKNLIVSENKTLLEIFTGNEDNASILKAYMTRIKQLN